MKNLFSLFTKNQSLIYKVFLFIFSTLLVIYLLPKGGQFKYNFQKGKPWQYENLYAPFSFTIKKDDDTLKKEKEELDKQELIFKKSLIRTLGWCNQFLGLTDFLNFFIFRWHSLTMIIKL